MTKSIKIKYENAHSDATYDYIIEIAKGMTVKQFIEEWLTHESEWGYFGIADGKSFFGNPRCEYAHGHIKGKPLSDDVLDKIILNVNGSGGWTRSDFLFEVE